jgi:signal peptidase I
MDVERRSAKRYHLIREIVETIILTVLIFFLINQAIQNFDVEGLSMEPRLHSGERVMVDKVTYLLRAPARGDVVVFVAPPEPSENYIKRIIAVPGDVIAIKDGVPTVNGVTLHEFYIDSHRLGASPSDRPVHDLHVPPDQYFVMGDNRVDSYDSRSWGLLPRKNIIGRAALVYWPFGVDNDGLLPDVSSVFASVPQARSAAGPSPFVFSEPPGPVEPWYVPGVAFDAVDPLRNVHL